VLEILSFTKSPGGQRTKKVNPAEGTLVGEAVGYAELHRQIVGPINSESMADYRFGVASVLVERDPRSERRCSGRLRRFPASQRGS
jgi:hypothetical protein